MEDEHPLVKIWRKEMEDPEAQKVVLDIWLQLHREDIYAKGCRKCQKDLMSQKILINVISIDALCQECAGLQ